MPPSVAVVGAGPAGTTLALGLLGRGCEVTLVTDRTAEEIRIRDLRRAGYGLTSPVTTEIVIFDAMTR